MNHFDDVVEELMAKTFAKDVELALGLLRKTVFPDVPTEYDFGMTSRYDGRGVVLKMRLTAGDVTTREAAEIPIDVVCDIGKRGTFNERLTTILARLAANFAMNWPPKKD